MEGDIDFIKVGIGLAAIAAFWLLAKGAKMIIKLIFCLIFIVVILWFFPPTKQIIENLFNG